MNASVHTRDHSNATITKINERRTIPKLRLIAVSEVTKLAVAKGILGLKTRGAH